MSLWKLFEGARYCGGVCEHSLKRYKRIRDNRDKLVELGFMTLDEPLECYRTKEWEEHTSAYSQYEILLNQYEGGLIKLEEVVNIDPRNPAERYSSDSDKDSPVVNKKKKSPNKKKSQKGKHKNGRVETKKIKVEQLDCVECVRQVNQPEEAEAPEVEELEMFLHSEPESVPALQDLLVNKNLASHLGEGPVDVCKLIAENPEFTHEICEANIDSLMSDEEFYKITCETYPGGWEKFLEDMENEESSDEEIDRIELPPDLYNELMSDKSNDVPDDDEEQYKFGRINKDQADTCLDRALELYDNYHNMTQDEYNKKVKEVLKDMDRITVLDNDVDHTKSSTNKSNIPQSKEYARTTPEPNDNLPSCSGTHNDTERSDMVTPDKSSSSYHKSETDNVIIDNTSGVTTESDTSSSSVTQTKKLPTILSNREVYENIDNIPRPSYWLPESEPDSEKKEEEIDDFEYLGMLDDGYLLSLFDEDKESEEMPNTAQTHISVPTEMTAARDNIQEDFSKTEVEAAAGKASKNRRSNPPRVAKEGVTYCDDNDNLEEVLQSEYFCWQCKDYVRGECELHGPLLPCLEDISQPGTKKTANFPVPSCIEIKESTIPRAGDGAFASQFIEPGSILGNYKGKVISEKEYKKLETSDKESGYAWRAVSQDGDVIYLDGASHRASNWLRFLNCARGQCEENVLVRNIPGGIQYYSYKPIGLGEELLVFYGEDYFEELGYSLQTDIENGQQYHCTATGCLKLFKTQQELETHTCGKTRGVSGKEKVHKCDTCRKMFAQRSHLTAHIRTVHDKVARHSCPYCKYKTDYQQVLTSHMLTHTGDKQYKCTHCDYTAITKQSLTLHIYNNHTNKTYKCRYRQCGVKKPSEQELYDHISTEHPLQQYRCDVCPMSFNTAGQLGYHKRTHGDRELESQHECKYCGKLFLQSGDLKKHALTHTGERPHKCSVCGKGFTVKCNLTRHMRIHTGEKPYSCSYCDRRFSESGDRNKHEITCKNKPC
ncbi:histone-lysine N-methyltransferase PRDM9-like [Bolinopsis microptera]|uniref:histone-lysine N-methyltransferase PRDM9-like n=1 Tax=Bolinopsis microptera TaxID=2820187 RepID=UPI0030791941